MLQRLNDFRSSQRLRSPWATLVILAIAQFMVVLDVTIVNVALPDVQRSLHFSTEDLQWVISAYTLTFGGFLLLGGRVGDLLGRRAVFLAGMTVFVGASLVAGLAQSSGMLVGARAVQGVGAALLSPSALSILTVTFPRGPQRNAALGIYGALAGIGGTLGVVAGGLLVDGIGWEWVFFVNVPFGLAVLAAAPLIVRESRAPRGEATGFDALGAVLGTSGLLALVYGVIRSGPLGWGSGEVVAFLAAGVLLLAAFVAAESRARSPLVPLSLFRSRGLSTASGVLALNGATFLGMFFLTALFLQQVRGDSAVQAGLHLLPMGITAIAGAIVASNLVARLGTRPIQITGTLLSLVGLVLLSRAGAHDAYATSLLPGLLLFGLGVTATGVPSQIAAVADVAHHEAGAASGLVTAIYQVGGALGVAIITTISSSRVTGAIADGASQQVALVDGFQRGLLVAAVLGGIGLAVAIGSPRLRPDADLIAEAVA